MVVSKVTRGLLDQHLGLVQAAKDVVDPLDAWIGPGLEGTKEDPGLGHGLRRQSASLLDHLAEGRFVLIEYVSPGSNDLASHLHRSMDMEIRLLIEAQGIVGLDLGVERVVLEGDRASFLRGEQPLQLQAHHLAGFPIPGVGQLSIVAVGRELGDARSEHEVRGPHALEPVESARVGEGTEHRDLLWQPEVGDRKEGQAVSGFQDQIVGGIPLQGLGHIKAQQFLALVWIECGPLHPCPDRYPEEAGPGPPADPSPSCQA